MGRLGREGSAGPRGQSSASRTVLTESTRGRSKGNLSEESPGSCHAGYMDTVATGAGNNSLPYPRQAQRDGLCLHSTAQKQQHQPTPPLGRTSTATPEAGAIGRQDRKRKWVGGAGGHAGGGAGAAAGSGAGAGDDAGRAAGGAAAAASARGGRGRRLPVPHAVGRRPAAGGR